MLEAMQNNEDRHEPRRSIRDIPLPSHRREAGGEAPSRPSLDGVRARRQGVRRAPRPPEADVADEPSAPEAILAEEAAEISSDTSYRYQNDMSEEQSYQRERRPRKGGRLIKMGVGAAVVVGLFLVATWHSATVTVVEKHAEKPLEAKIALVAEGQPAAPGTLPFKPVEVSDSASQTLAATGEAAVKTKSSGTITIFNNFSATDQPLVKNTRFETPEGLVFRIDQPVVVPGQKAGAPGSVEAKVFADQPGVAYNVGPVAKFTVPGFKGKPQFDGFYATSKAPMQGGFDGVQKVPDPKEEAAAIDKLTQDLSAKLAVAAASSAGQGYVAYLMPGTFAVRSTSRTPAGDKVTVTVQASAKAAAVSRQGLAEEIAVATIPTYIRGTGATVEAWDAVRGMPEGGDVPSSLTLSGQASVTWAVDPAAVAKALAGKPLTEVSKVATQFPGIDSFTPVVRPFWRSAFPANPAKISVAVSPSKN